MGGRVREAIFQYVAAVEIAPERVALRDELAHAYLDIGRPDAARSQWEMAAFLAPMSTEYPSEIQAIDAARR